MKYINLTLFIPKLPHLGVGGHKIQFPVSLPYRCYIPNLVKIGSVPAKTLTYDTRLTPTLSKRSPELRW